MEQKNNTGAIFKNDKKTAENQPDYKGKITVDNKQWEISLWVRIAQSGVKYMSASIQEPYVKPAESIPVYQSAPETAPAPISTTKKIQNETEADDDLPF